MDNVVCGFDVDQCAKQTPADISLLCVFFLSYDTNNCTVFLSLHITSSTKCEPDRVLRCRHVAIIEPPPKIISLLREAGFYHAAHILNFGIDTALVSALVERWRTETRKFYLICGETTITLENMVPLLGFPINGHEVIGQTSRLGSAVYAELLEVVPSADQRKGQNITLTWLEKTFGMLSYDAG
ncbi:protein MAIN-LIKE 2-like [Dioscorea cayenensis subsp. rotundata]|uniref:Protein MAIN-LIKE 2-like n=1 Tax=Dioscorea cayennensis subsp. rotundata TaxID=55577 RepID=A0AB40AUM0_DIOCR|nr:protein MAIN-LIKE 2-like [Dioscorea cayenensis subsp. rotundata]